MSKDSPKCQMCGKKFDCNSKLQFHLKVHLAYKTHKCIFCLAEYRRKTICIAIISTTPKKNHVCKMCDLECMRKDQLQLYKRCHNGETLFQYELCHKNFSKNEDLRAHYITHTREKPFKCEICDTIFSLKGDLKKHKEVHKSLRTYFHCDFL